VQPATLLVVLLQRLEGGEHFFLRFVVEQLEQHFRRERFRRREHQRLDDCLQLRAFESWLLLVGLGRRRCVILCW
jgi:hypothetical protein